MQEEDSTDDGPATAVENTPEVTETTVNADASLLAYDDLDFLLQDELRPVRLLLEFTKPELVLRKHGIDHTVVVFGSARTTDQKTADSACQAVREELKLQPDNAELQHELKLAQAPVRHAQYYRQARELAAAIAQRSACEVYVVKPSWTKLALI